MFDGSPPVQAHGTEVIGVDCDAELSEALVRATSSQQYDPAGSVRVRVMQRHPRNRHGAA
jgi:hypothetical protein